MTEPNLDELAISTIRFLSVDAVQTPTAETALARTTPMRDVSRVVASPGGADRARPCGSDGALPRSTKALR